MMMIDGMRTQLTNELVNRKLIRGLEESSSNAKSVGIVRCVLVCFCVCVLVVGLYGVYWYVFFVVCVLLFLLVHVYYCT